MSAKGSPVGSVRWSPSWRLQRWYIIHAVTPVEYGSHSRQETCASQKRSVYSHGCSHRANNPALFARRHINGEINDPMTVVLTPAINVSHFHESALKCLLHFVRNSICWHSSLPYFKRETLRPTRYALTMRYTTNFTNIPIRYDFTGRRAFVQYFTLMLAVEGSSGNLWSKW